MQFLDRPLEPFGEVILSMAVPTQLSFKMPLVFRMIKEMVKHKCLPEGGDPRVELALDEALTNAMVHGNKLDPEKKVRVRLFCDRDRWGAIMEDEGAGFSPQNLARPEEDEELLLEEAGRGIILMEGAVDQVLFNPAGSAVMLVRRRSTEHDAALQAAGRARAQAAAAPPAEAAAAVSRQGDAVVIELRQARLSEQNVGQVRRHADEALALGSRIVLDMGRVTYVSSVVIGLLVTLNKSARAAGGRLVLAAVQPVVLDVLSSVKMDKLLTIAESRDQAVAMLHEETAS